MRNGLDFLAGFLAQGESKNKKISFQPQYTWKSNEWHKNTEDKCFFTVRQNLAAAHNINKNSVELVTKERIMCAENEIIKSFGWKAFAFESYFIQQYKAHNWM